MSDDERLQVLLDRAEISDLILAFGAALDAKDWDAYGNTFTEDGSFTIAGQKRTGREEIVAGPARDLTRYDRLQHFLTNQRIVVDGDEATAVTYVLGVHVPDESKPEAHADIGGRYEARCVRTPDGWRFADIVLELQWAGGSTEFVVESHGADEGTTVGG